MRRWHALPHSMRVLPLLVTVVLLALPSTAGVTAQASPYPGEQDHHAGTPVAPGTPAAEPPVIYLTPEEIAAFAAACSYTPLIGGQVAPRLSKWVTYDVFLF